MGHSPCKRFAPWTDRATAERAPLLTTPSRWLTHSVSSTRTPSLTRPAAARPQRARPRRLQPLRRYSPAHLHPVRRPSWRDAPTAGAAAWPLLGREPLLVEEFDKGEEMVLNGQAARLSPVRRDTVVVTSGGSMPEGSVTDSLRIQTVQAWGPAPTADDPPVGPQLRRPSPSMDPRRLRRVRNGLSKEGPRDRRWRCARRRRARPWCVRLGDCEGVCPSGRHHRAAALLGGACRGACEAGRYRAAS